MIKKLGKIVTPSGVKKSHGMKVSNPPIISHTTKEEEMFNRRFPVFLKMLREGDTYRIYRYKF